MEESGAFHAPALLTGTSGEYMGGRPAPKLLHARHVVFVLGPRGVGKSTVARTLAGSNAVTVDAEGLERALLDRVRTGGWPPRLSSAPAVVLDGPVWLRNRKGAVSMLAELAHRRAEAERRTVVCQVEEDGSIDALIASMRAGSSVVLGLRFPRGRRARLRCARRLCTELGLPQAAATGSEGLDPWRYDRLVAWLVERAWREP